MENTTCDVSNIPNKDIVKYNMLHDATFDFSIKLKTNNSVSPVQITNIGGSPKLEIVDVSDSYLDSFLQELKDVPVFALSVACEQLKEKKNLIRPPKNAGNRNCFDNRCIIEPDIIIKGISICFGGPSFFIPFANETAEKGSTEQFIDKMKSIQNFFHNILQKAQIIVYNLKEHYRMLWQCSNISLQLKKDLYYFDPSIAAWLLDPSSGLHRLNDLQNFWPESANVMKTHKISSIDSGSLYWSTISGKLRSSTETFFIYHLMPRLLKALKENELYNSFKDIEMPSILAFAKMEQNGLGFNADLAAKYQQELQKRQQDILEKSYKLAGRRFNICSSKDISRILYKELKLNKDIAPDSPKVQKHLAIGGASHSRRLPPELKTNKECLEKIIHLHPFPKAILDWRRLSFATTKVLMPLLRKSRFDNFFQMNRLYSICFYHTLTGRVHMHSPNLQFIPRNFNIENVKSDSLDEEAYECNDEFISQYGVSLRNLFIPCKGCILLTADYSQLELRILAHLSGDKKLLNSLNCDEDVFKKIASIWKGISIVSVTKDMREQAKRICYGIIYGISAKTLAEQLKSSEKEAITFMETFKNTYPSLEIYFQSVLKSCSTKGYITTLACRRRYLPHIKSSNKSEKSQAERQAINTTIQGSAADIIKAAMVKIDKDLEQLFPESSLPYSSTQKNCPQKPCTETIRGGFLVLQMHDELIYEVNEKDLKTVINIVKKGMEETTKLSVKLPVKIHIGHTWGTKEEFS